MDREELQYFEGWDTLKQNIQFKTKLLEPICSLPVNILDMIAHFAISFDIGWYKKDMDGKKLRHKCITIDPDVVYGEKCPTPVLYSFVAWDSIFVHVPVIMDLLRDKKYRERYRIPFYYTVDNPPDLPRENAPFLNGKKRYRAYHDDSVVYGEIIVRPCHF